MKYLKLFEDFVNERTIVNEANHKEELIDAIEMIEDEEAVMNFI